MSKTFKICDVLNVNLKMSEGTCIFKIILRERKQKGLKTSGSGIQEAPFEHRGESISIHLLKVGSSFSVKGASLSTSGANYHPSNPGTSPVLLQEVYIKLDWDFNTGNLIHSPFP